ncbi:MAG: hypothetical protein ACYS0I_10740 [Planctomycetota bacterium]|jgi:hypothetical protein
MNLEHVSVENSQSRHQLHPPQENKSTIFPRMNIEASFQPRSTRADIDQILAKLSDKGLSAKEHVKAYLHVCMICIGAIAAPAQSVATAAALFAFA